MKIFHYLFEQHPGVVEGKRSADGKYVSASGIHVYFTLPQCMWVDKLEIDPRDQRVLIAFDGELLSESAPKGADLLSGWHLSTLETKVEHLRKPRFGDPWYAVDCERGIATFELFRHFLLTPCGNFVFRRVRDKRSLSPMYVFAVVERVDGEPQVTWRNTTY